VDLADACLQGGAKVLQVRAKRAPSRDLLAMTEGVVALARRAGALVIVNDRADIARLAGAGGVHVGQEDLSPAQVHAVAGGGAVVGLSTHTEAQVERALAQPISYLAIGPVFSTRTKETGYDAVGLARVAHAVARARTAKLGVVAIGGITLERAPSVIEAGADAVAVISDLLVTGDPEGRVREYLTRMTVS
jgi:thiamine-phosphate pyrophosphorylase